MTFMVSDALKGRVTEDELAVDAGVYIEEDTVESVIFALVTLPSQKKYKFSLIEMQHEQSRVFIAVEIPSTHEYLSNILNKNVNVKVKSGKNTVFNSNVYVDNFLLTSQRESNCYALKIFIDKDSEED